MVAMVVPIGMDRDGFFRSPESPTPAVIPVKAGNIMAKAIKKLPGLRIPIFSNVILGFPAASVPPKKNMTSEIKSKATTT